MYKNCSEIPIFNFFELVKTRDFKLLLEEGEKIEDFKKEDLIDTIKNLMLEYNALTQNRRLMQEYQARLDIDYLEAKYHLTKELIAMYKKYKNIEILLTIKRFGWQLNTAEDIEPQLVRITKNLVGIKNKLNIKKINFVKKFNKEHNESTPNFDLERSVIALEVGIPLSYKIDIYKDSIKRYIFWSQALENKNKALKNG